MMSIVVDGLIFTGCACTVGLVYRVVTKSQAANEIETSEEPERIEIGLLSTNQDGATQDVGRIERFDRWFRHQIYLSKLPISENNATTSMLGVTVLLGATIFVFTDNIPAAVFASLSAGSIFLLTVVITAKYRLRQFRKQFPMALDIMARAVRSGESLQDAVGLLSKTMQEPAKTEFVRLRNQLDMGLSLRATMQSFATRITSLDARIFATTLAVHRDTGGQLGPTLQRMATVIRSRFEYERHMQATAGMGRVSVMVVVALAWLIAAYLMVFKPDYARSLWETTLGQQMLMAALVMEMIGVIWAVGLMKSDY